MLRNIAMAVVVVAALCMPLAASARSHGHGGHHGGGHHGGMHHHGGHHGGMHHRGSHRGHGHHSGHHGRRHHHSHARHFWHGRWYVYGVGPCWRWSNYYDEFVWVCS